MIAGLFFSTVLLISGTATLFVTSSHQSVESAFASLNNTLPDSWAVIKTVEGEQKVFYDTTLLEESTIKHFKNNLNSYTNSFTLGFYYFDAETLERSEDRYVTGARISLETKLFFSFDSKKANTYVVGKGAL